MKGVFGCWTQACGMGVDYRLDSPIRNTGNRRRLARACALTEHALPLLEQARISCLASLEDDVRVAQLTQAETVRPGARARLERWWNGSLAYPTLKVGMPVFIGIGADDGLATRGLSLAKDACAAGTTVEAHLYTGVVHNGTVNASLADSLQFVRKVLAGQTIAPVCEPAGQTTASR